jgi:hypothetical protein
VKGLVVRSQYATLADHATLAAMTLAIDAKQS